MTWVLTILVLYLTYIVLELKASIRATAQQVRANTILLNRFLDILAWVEKSVKDNNDIVGTLPDNVSKEIEKMRKEFVIKNVLSIP